MIDVVIDVSHWQDPVDDIRTTFTQGGIIGIIHKATESTGYVDEDYQRRKDLAAENGVMWGAYHFLRPGDMVQQAQHFVRTAGDIDLYAADHEDAGVTLDALKAFLQEVEQLTGQCAVIYSGHVIKDQVQGCDQALARHRLWIAHYASTPTWPTETWPSWWLWQYTDTGSVPGGSGNVDRDRYEGTVAQLRADWKRQTRKVA